MDVHKTLNPFYTTEKMSYVMATVAKKCAVLAAIARYIMIIFTKGYLQVFKQGTFFTEVLTL